MCDVDCYIDEYQEELKRDGEKLRAYKPHECKCKITSKSRFDVDLIREKFLCGKRIFFSNNEIAVINEVFEFVRKEIGG